MPKATQGRRDSNSSHYCPSENSPKWSLRTSCCTGQSWPPQRHPAGPSSPGGGSIPFRKKGDPVTCPQFPPALPVLECGLDQMTSPL